ncbi:uncharacterized protein A4U43_C01F14530 [Asparagus officinalis]|uniref:Uncharacterized protein n=1 Tax=Asparagus officinalis TaxID=4686 RepID=A0A5P1FU01_ASPOF|nr:uncharacterized protein LOC109823264 [Asparagus officinalis]ONK80160.1 uncharacterized protein A4U43_C01F14530 [Asparagus officinalis]
MEASILPLSHPLHSSSPFRRPTSLKIQPSHLRLTLLHAVSSNGETSTNSDDDGQNKADETSATTPRPALNTLNIRYRARSKRQARKQQEQEQQSFKPPPPPKKEWESMTLAEKAVELYVGEKGLLFWLNKFAYASIFIIIGGWIVFRFVGPSLGLYELDAPPLSPTSILKGSP